MNRILTNLMETGCVKIVVFHESLILHKPIEEWPVVEAALAFFSTGYPLEKVEAYVALHKPVLINDLSIQVTMIISRLAGVILRITLYLR